MVTVVKPIPPVWIIDDNKAVTDSLAMLLRTDGIPAREMYNVGTALGELISGNMPPLIVLDLNMPGRRGDVLLQDAAKHPEWTFPIIVLSGYTDDLAPELLPRVHKMMIKAIDPGTILEEVRRALKLTPILPDAK